MAREYTKLAVTAYEGEQMLQDTFGDSYQRLRQVKTKYDPTNMFRVNQNIQPLPSSNLR